MEGRRRTAMNEKIKEILSEIHDVLENEAYIDEELITDEDGELDEIGSWVVSRDEISRLVNRLEEALLMRAEDD
jgi:hypothetical protein